MVKSVLLFLATLICAHAEAACPSGTRTQTAEEAHRDCTQGGRVTAYKTECYDQNDHCVSAYQTVGGKDYSCADCSCYPEPATTVYQQLDVLCNETVDCDGGTCAAGQICCNGKCIPSGTTCCSDGSSCTGACATNGMCCPDNLPVYDGTNGYCCGKTDPNNTSTICECANSCPSIQGCCPANTVCCDGGWCAANTTGCPNCPASAPLFCPDGTCAPAGSICCGGGRYCPNGLSCADAGGGQITCGGGGTAPSSTMSPTQPVGSAPATHSALKAMEASTPGTTPKGASTGTSNPLAPGCKCDMAGRAPAPWALFGLSALLFARRRRRVR